ncbi:MAG TPA: DUF433 domain-containing protein [Ardenticatenaceae bacterium]|jgi:uncharacterized protein (DUF433 family)
MDWTQHIHSDREILLGKPVIKGTRLTVDWILRLLATGWTEQQLFESYPHLTPQALQAVFAFLADYITEEALYTLPQKSG